MKQYYAQYLTDTYEIVIIFNKSIPVENYFKALKNDLLKVYDVPGSIYSFVVLTGYSGNEQKYYKLLGSFFKYSRGFPNRLSRQIVLNLLTSAGFKPVERIFPRVNSNINSNITYTTINFQNYNWDWNGDLNR